VVNANEVIVYTQIFSSSRRLSAELLTSFFDLLLSSRSGQMKNVVWLRIGLCGIWERIGASRRMSSAKLTSVVKQSASGPVNHLLEYRRHRMAAILMRHSASLYYESTLLGGSAGQTTDRLGSQLYQVRQHIDPIRRGYLAWRQLSKICVNPVYASLQSDDL
jgi:hypothetical protein